MRNILAHMNREVLAQFAWSNVLLAFDYDGTLAPIVNDPKRAVMRSTTRSLLEQAAEIYPVVVISGRARDDALARLRGIDVQDVVGNHGLEPLHASAVLVRRVEAWRTVLQQSLARLPGVRIEDKRYSLSIHYRQSRQKKSVRAAILQAVAPLGQVRVVGGKQVVNLLPPGAPHKGVALEQARERFGCDTAIYVGDDETDEDVFTLDQPGRLLGIRVGLKRASAARYYVQRQSSLDQLLRTLVQLRAALERPKQVMR